jgi:hypothetical protein
LPRDQFEFDEQADADASDIQRESVEDQPRGLKEKKLKIERKQVRYIEDPFTFINFFYISKW